MAAPNKRSRRARSSAPKAGDAPKNWLVRSACALVIGTLGAFSVSHSSAFLLRSPNAEVAHQLAPYDGRITALAAASRASAVAMPEDRSEADVLARLALRQDATAMVAASTLGLNAQVRNEDKVARKLFGYAEALSRRDIQTQLWAIEDAVKRDDIVDALKHYDTALRVTPSLSELLFPVLSKASEDPQIRAPLVKTLLAKPAWGDWFIAYASAKSSNPQSTAQMLKGIARAGIKLQDDAQTNMVTTLSNAGFMNEAWNYYAAIRRGANRGTSRDPHFVLVTDTPTAFDWNIVAATGISSSILRNGSSGIFDFAAPAMIGGQVLQQLQFLPPGSYRLAGHSIGVEQARSSRSYWMLSCKQGREIGRVAIPNSAEANGKFEGTFIVPPECPVQVLAFVVAPSQVTGGTSGEIDFVLLSPQGSSSQN